MVRFLLQLARNLLEKDASLSASPNGDKATSFSACHTKGSTTYEKLMTIFFCVYFFVLYFIFEKCKEKKSENKVNMYA